MPQGLPFSEYFLQEGVRRLPAYRAFASAEGQYRLEEARRQLAAPFQGLGPASTLGHPDQLPEAAPAFPGREATFGGVLSKRPACPSRFAGFPAEPTGASVALRLTPGNTSDIEAADELLEDASRFKCLVADRGNDADRFRATLRKPGRHRSVRAASTGSDRSTTTGNDIGNAGGLRRPSAGSRMSGTSPLATARSPSTPTRPSHSPLPWPSGYD